MTHGIDHLEDPTFMRVTLPYTRSLVLKHVAGLLRVYQLSQSIQGVSENNGIKRGFPMRKLLTLSIYHSPTSSALHNSIPKGKVTLSQTFTPYHNNHINSPVLTANHGGQYRQTPEVGVVCVDGPLLTIPQP